MDKRYRVGQKLVRLDTKIPEFVVVVEIWEPKWAGGSFIYIFENGGGIGEEYVCTLEELKSIHKELNLVCTNCSDQFSAILKDNGIFTKLFNIENFLCELDEL